MSACVAGSLVFLCKTRRLPIFAVKFMRLGNAGKLEGARKRRMNEWMSRKDIDMVHTDWNRREETAKAPPKMYAGIWGGKIDPPQATGTLWEKKVPDIDSDGPPSSAPPGGVHDVSLCGVQDGAEGLLTGDVDVEVSLFEDGRGEGDAPASSRGRDWTLFGGGVTSRSYAGSVCSASAALNTSRSVLRDVPHVRLGFDEGASAGGRRAGAAREEDAASSVSAVSESISSTGTWLSRMSAVNRAIVSSQQRLMTNIAMLAEGGSPSAKSVPHAEEIRGDFPPFFSPLALTPTRRGHTHFVAADKQMVRTDRHSSTEKKR